MVELNRYCWCLNMLKHHHFDDLNQCVWWLNCRDEWFPVRLRQDAAEGKPAATRWVRQAGRFPSMCDASLWFLHFGPEMLFFFLRISNLTGRNYPPLIKHGSGNSSIYSRWFFPLNRHFGFSTAMVDYQRVVVMFRPCRGGDGWASRQGGPAATWLIAVNSSVFLICSSWPKEQELEWEISMNICRMSWNKSKAEGARKAVFVVSFLISSVSFRGCWWNFPLSVLGWVDLGLQFHIFHGRIVGCHQSEKSEVRISVGTCISVCLWVASGLASEMNGSNRDMMTWSTRDGWIDLMITIAPTTESSLSSPPVTESRFMSLLQLGTKIFSDKGIPTCWKPMKTLVSLNLLILRANHGFWLR